MMKFISITVSFLSIHAVADADAGCVGSGCEHGLPVSFIQKKVLQIGENDALYGNLNIDSTPVNTQAEFTMLLDGESCTDTQRIDQGTRVYTMQSAQACYEYCKSNRECTHFTWFQGVACRRFKACPQTGRYRTSTQPSKTYAMPEAMVWTKLGDGACMCGGGLCNRNLMMHAASVDDAKAKCRSTAECTAISWRPNLKTFYMVMSGAATYMGKGSGPPTAASSGTAGGGDWNCWRFETGTTDQAQ